MTCSQRLARIAAAGLAYAAEDSDELAIPIGEGDASTTGAWPSYYSYGGKGGLGWGPDAERSVFGGKYLMGTRARPLNAILYKRVFEDPPLVPAGRGTFVTDWYADTRLDLDVYRCPSDTRFSGMHHAGWRDMGGPSYDCYGTSYAANALFAGFPGDGTPLDSISPYARPVSRVPNPAATILYQENAARFAYKATNPEHDQTGCFWPYEAGDLTANGWHGTPWEFFTAHTDGHVAKHHIKGHGRGFDVPSHLVCVYVRGDGYQYDTLPADPLRLPKIRQSDSSAGPWEIVDAD